MDQATIDQYGKFVEDFQENEKCNEDMVKKLEVSLDKALKDSKNYNIIKRAKEEKVEKLLEEEIGDMYEEEEGDFDDIFNEPLNKNISKNQKETEEREEEEEEESEEGEESEFDEEELMNELKSRKKKKGKGEEDEHKEKEIEEEKEKSEEYEYEPLNKSEDSMENLDGVEVGKTETEGALLELMKAKIITSAQCQKAIDRVALGIFPNEYAEEIGNVLGISADGSRFSKREFIEELKEMKPAQVNVALHKAHVEGNLSLNDSIKLESAMNNYRQNKKAKEVLEKSIIQGGKRKPLPWKADPQGLEESGYTSKTEALEDLCKAVRLGLIHVKPTAIKTEELIQKSLPIPRSTLKQMEKAHNSSL